jgi:hypothetical protein
MKGINIGVESCGPFKLPLPCVDQRWFLVDSHHGVSVSNHFNISSGLKYGYPSLWWLKSKKYLHIYCRTHGARKCLKNEHGYFLFDNPIRSSPHPYRSSDFLTAPIVSHWFHFEVKHNRERIYFWSRISSHIFTFLVRSDLLRATDLPPSFQSSFIPRLVPEI